MNGNINIWKFKDAKAGRMKGYGGAEEKKGGRKAGRSRYGHVDNGFD